MASKKPADVIVAIATAPGRGGIGVVRLSGPDLASQARQLTGRELSPRLATFGRFLDAAAAEIDEGIALYFPAPHSYTGEDVLELQGHGGPVVMELLLQRCLELGARLAEPGEFTRRAFFNDKLDLAQAEAVADLIEASTAAAARSAIRSLSGEFSSAVHELVEQLIALRTLVEATLDFPEEDVDFLHQTDADGRLSAQIRDVDRLLAKARQGSLLRKGLHVVLVGQPNVGKSSLLNRLAGEERAIVTAIPGTTRDALRETIQIEGIPLHVIDTAGLRETEDEIEQLGIARSWKEIGRADVVLHMLDARTGMTEADRTIVARLPGNIEQIVLHNKSDLAGHAASREVAGGRVALWLSAKTGDGMSLLEQELLRVAGWQAGAEDVFMARERHLLALKEARAHLLEAQARQAQAELLAEELRLAQEALGSITGEFTPDDLLGEIFSRFCIGK
ncbi:MAG: tRNA uridine-5-carboxymethylaminomethyl(34) synthesis GTPase MnmE [Rhodocyclaceae bacterium]|nr:tRNA uridine-5-carboxymethylaminomethyl(34) synthesis GTPase MnmE [Rhodocyclaceae bacterium]MCL4680420.1 tRNA uridine-5-carboxymethylaminomethyl(34) synthesis GTPase MnmE [Rhodocyclaceae bacterium]